MALALQAANFGSQSSQFAIQGAQIHGQVGLAGNQQLTESLRRGEQGSVTASLAGDVASSEQQIAERDIYSQLSSTEADANIRYEQSLNQQQQRDNYLIAQSRQQAIQDQAARNSGAAQAIGQSQSNLLIERLQAGRQLSDLQLQSDQSLLRETEKSVLGQLTGTAQADATLRGQQADIFSKDASSRAELDNQYESSLASTRTKASAELALARGTIRGYSNRGDTNTRELGLDYGINV